MRVFVTGGSGWIGKAVIPELISNGHKVLALAHSDASVALLEGFGAEVIRGSIEDLESLKAGAAAADGVIHLAFINDFTKMPESCAKDRDAIKALGDTLAASGVQKPLVVTSGCLVLEQGKLATEDDKAHPSNPVAALRGQSETLTLSFAEKGVRASVIRLAPTNHGKGDRGFTAMITGLARTKGVSAYVGEGESRWCAVHRDDSAKLYRLVLENGKAGQMYHSVAEESVKFKDIATAIGKAYDLPTVSLKPEDMHEHFGHLVFAVGTDNPVSSKMTRQELGWKPVHPTLVEDIANRAYTDSVAKH